MNRDLYYSYIDEKLHILAHRITTNGKLNMLHLHLHSENFYLHFFNLLYGYNLENLNDVSQNVEAIDLIDYQKKVMIQVSSTSTKQKIESALNKDKLKEYVGYEFKFISIAKDATDLRGKTYKNPNSIKFDPPKDIYDIRFFLNTISSLDIEKLKKIHDFIHQELGDGNQNRFTPNILKDKYLNKFNEIKLLINSTSKPIEHIFINLAIIKDKKEKKENNKLISRDAFLSSYEEIHKPKEPIEIKDLIDTSKKSLIYGKAGIGKTTLCKYISYMWAKGELYQEFEYVIYISLREWKNRGLKGAIKDNYYSQDDEDITLDIKDKSQNILFLFDGYDELDSDRKKLLRDEIDKYSLTDYIITTRPYGYQRSDFRVDEQFETIGFTDENVDNYIDNFFDKDANKKSQSLKSYLESNISIKHIAYIPLMLEMICSLWDKEELDNNLTMTELYSESIENMFFEYTEKNGTAYIQDKEEEIFNYLGKIAFEGLKQQTILLDKNIIKEKRTFFSDYVLKAGFLNDGEAKNSNPLRNSYQFPHLTFQEYFAALYVSNLSQEEQSEIIRDWKFYPHMQMFFAFWGGLIEDKEFLIGGIQSEPKDLIGFFEFDLVLRVSEEVDKKLTKDFLFWVEHLSQKIDSDYKHFIDNFFIKLNSLDKIFVEEVLKNFSLFKDNILMYIIDKIILIGYENEMIMNLLLDFVYTDTSNNSKALVGYSLVFHEFKNICIDYDELEEYLDDVAFEYSDKYFMGFAGYEAYKSIEELEDICELTSNLEEILSKYDDYYPIINLITNENVDFKDLMGLIDGKRFLQELITLVTVENIYDYFLYKKFPLFIINKKLLTIENGNQISTQIEVDEVRLNEIRMLHKGDSLDD
ncbi:MAG: Unknown protein [uncultured Sulfurovum sp.]|uniref:NACHT domain-containing protein n=1 Tax=uncultured Sulfurovum sp. TaxID=269237 RepID=A0A6S6S9Y2_9BACT|nr:MAG: Unknown protein [uncultured Sulfurovum sp.]